MLRRAIKMKKQHRHKPTSSRRHRLNFQYLSSSISPGSSCVCREWYLVFHVKKNTFLSNSFERNVPGFPHIFYRNTILKYIHSHNYHSRARQYVHTQTFYNDLQFLSIHDPISLYASNLSRIRNLFSSREEESSRS